ncbi:hypothetical protein ABB02_00227 [Clostridiaceae bacterium JG1575]|nr:hypothetical protein ABB02_00227 [Clostridiaceae bacterium JG1575]
MNQTKKNQLLWRILIVALLVSFVLPFTAPLTSAAPKEQSKTERTTKEKAKNNSSEKPSSALKRNAEISGNADSYVTSIRVTPENIWDGQNATVRIDYSEGYGNIQGGDVIEVTWPTTGDLIFKGFKTTVPLKISGIHVADLIVTLDGAKIVFNNNINPLDDVTDWAEFQIQGRNLTATDGEDTKTGTIVAGNKRANVSVTKSSSGYVSNFYSKVGDMSPEDPDHVRWFLLINNNKNYVEGPIRIEDQIQPGQTLVMDSFDINVEGVNPGRFYGASALENFKSRYGGTTFSASGNPGKLTIIIPQAHGSLNYFMIHYRTKINQPNQKEFANHSQAWYKENGKEPVYGEEFNFWVQNISAGGGIDGTVKGELRIHKFVNGTSV